MAKSAVPTRASRRHVSGIFEEVDQIYNLACPSAPADYMHDPVMTLKTSLIGAVNMLEVARRMLGARILQASSGKV